MKLTSTFVADELDAIADATSDLRHDPRDPSQLIVAKIDLERRTRRLAEAVRRVR